MPKNKVLPRIFIVLFLMGLFGYSAYFLYQKQHIKLNYLSFSLPNSTSVVVPDMHKLFTKLQDIENLQLSELPSELKEATQALMAKPELNLNKILNESCFISYAGQDFNVAFYSTSTFSAIVESVNASFETEFVLDGQQLKGGGVSLNFNQYGNYYLLSTLDFEPVKNVVEIAYGNADFIVFEDDDQFGTRHILSDQYHFTLNENESEKLLGKTVNPAGYFSVAPGVFDVIEFYGSARIGEDQNVYFKNAKPDTYAWLDNGLLYCKKDSFELVIARQGISRDLGLMLEESTVAGLTESNLLPTFDIGKFKILPFAADYNWEESLPPLSSNLKFYTENEEYNVLTNSLAAMRWYIGLIQLGNVFTNNESDYKIYTDCLPQNVHRISLFKNDSTFECSSGIYQNRGTMLTTYVSAKKVNATLKNVEIKRDFNVSIVPKYIQVIGNYPTENVLISSASSVVMCTSKGDQSWQLNLSTQLVQEPQIVDFEADGMVEIVLFQENQVDVVNNSGKSLPGFPVQLNGNCKAGLAVNYDNLNNYRIIVHSGLTVKLLSEEGDFVEGWMFGGMTAPIQGKIYHVLTEGKDIIAFKDTDKNQYVLSRRGESRMQNQVKFTLKNETDFVIGGMSSALRKMGYSNGYIHNYYILDGDKDSIKVDKAINPTKIYWEYNNGDPLMIAEESDRLLIVDQFGYVKSEVLKPGGSNVFVGLVGNKEFGFVFADNSQNSIYLLNNFGKMMLPAAVSGSSVSVINGDLLYTFSGISIKAYKI